MILKDKGRWCQCWQDRLEFFWANLWPIIYASPSEVLQELEETPKAWWENDLIMHYSSFIRMEQNITATTKHLSCYLFTKKGLKEGPSGEKTVAHTKNDQKRNLFWLPVNYCFGSLLSLYQYLCGLQRVNPKNSWHVISWTLQWIFATMFVFASKHQTFI